MKTKIIYITLLFLLLLSSCYVDRGNYEYETINKITIDLGNNGFLDKYTSDTLDITPELTFSGETESDISYFWYCNNEEISQEPVLNYPVRDLTGRRPFIKLKVVNNRDQSTFLAGFYVEIIPDYMTGWIILTKKNERSVISFVNPVSYNVNPDFYTKITGAELGPDAIEVKQHWPFDALSIGSVLVIRNEEGGNIELDGTNLNPLYNTNDFFLAKTVPVDFRPVGEYYMWDYSFILDDNRNLYQRKHQDNKLFQSGVYANKPMFIPNGVKFDKGWSGPWMSGLTLFYDKSKGCLYVGSDFGSVMGVSFVNVFPGMPGNYTLIDNMNKELVYVGNIKQGRFASPFFLIYKDASSVYYVQKIQVVHQGTFCQVIHMGETSFGTGYINDQTIFCQLDRKPDYLFFSGGNGNKTLCMYEHPTSKSTEYYTFDSPIKTICSDLSNASNNMLMVGLENGELYFIGIAYQNMMDSSTRLINKVVLDEGVPVSSFYKCGYQYTQF